MSLLLHTFLGSPVPCPSPTYWRLTFAHGPFFTLRVLSVTIPQGPCKNPSYPNSSNQQLSSPVYSTPTDLGLFSLLHCPHCSKLGHSSRSLPLIWSLLKCTSFSASRKHSKRPPYHDTPALNAFGISQRLQGKVQLSVLHKALHALP